MAAAWCAGRRAYVLCCKSLRPLLEAEAAKYYELRRTEFVTPKNERGWDAKPDTQALVVLGRYARNGSSCEREAHALRSVYRQLRGSTADLDALELPVGAQPFVGRGRPLLYLGEPVERVPKSAMTDRLAARLQDADRIATVKQFVGRERRGEAFVLLLRGDPTLAADALVEAKDLPEALPAVEVARRRNEAPRDRARDGARSHA